MNQMLTTIATVAADVNQGIIDESLKRIEASEDYEGLKVINDQASVNVLLKMYRTYIDDTNFQGLPIFLMAVDELLQEYGGRPKQDKQRIIDEEEAKERLAAQEND